MLENIGKDNDANFEAKPDKIKDDDYARALYCLRRHLNILECVWRAHVMYYEKWFKLQ